MNGFFSSGISSAGVAAIRPLISQLYIKIPFQNKGNSKEIVFSVFICVTQTIRLLFGQHLHTDKNNLDFYCKV